MSLMNDILNVDGLDLLTDEEKKFNTKYIKMLHGYADGTVDGVHIKALTAGAANLVKKQQSRSAVALLKWNMTSRGAAEESPQIESKVRTTNGTAFRPKQCDKCKKLFTPTGPNQKTCPDCK